MIFEECINPMRDLLYTDMAEIRAKEKNGMKQVGWVLMAG